MKDLCGIYFSIQAALFPMPKEEKIENSGKKRIRRRNRKAAAAGKGGCAPKYDFRNPAVDCRVKFFRFSGNVTW